MGAVATARLRVRMITVATFTAIAAFREMAIVVMGRERARLRVTCKGFENKKEEKKRVHCDLAWEEEGRKGQGDIRI